MPHTTCLSLTTCILDLLVAFGVGLSVYGTAAWQVGQDVSSDASVCAISGIYAHDQAAEL